MFEEENLKLANEFSERGKVKHFLLRKGFMPHDDEDAEIILENIFAEWEKFCEK